MIRFYREFLDEAYKIGPQVYTCEIDVYCLTASEELFAVMSLHATSLWLLQSDRDRSCLWAIQPERQSVREEIG